MFELMVIDVHRHTEFIVIGVTHPYHLQLKIDP